MVPSLSFSFRFLKSYRGFVCHSRIELNDVLAEWTTANKVFSSSLHFKVLLLVVDIQSLYLFLFWFCFFVFFCWVQFCDGIIADPVTNNIKGNIGTNFPLLILLDLVYFRLSRYVNSYVLGYESFQHLFNTFQLRLLLLNRVRYSGGPQRMPSVADGSRFRQIKRTPLWIRKNINV